MAVDLVAWLVANVRAILGLRPADPARNLPEDGAELWRYGLFRAEVRSAAADGSTVDVAPEDPRIPAMQRVPVRVGIPASVAVVQAGAVVLVGWERGDQTRPYAVPSWEAGATTIRLALSAQTKIEIDGGTLLTLDGTLVKLNGGTLPIARQTDTAGPYPITGGNPTVLG